MTDHGNSDLMPDELPPEFATQHHRLLADSHDWETHLPTSERLNHYAWQLEHQAQATPATRHPSFLRSLFHPLPKGQVSPTMTHSRTQRVFPAIAVLIIVALLGVVFTQIRAHNVATPHATPPASATQPTHDTTWVHLPQLDSTAAFASNNATALAPTDPRVVYETFAKGANASGPDGAAPNADAMMRRSDDGGQTWHALTFPVPPTHIAYAGIMVSPLDAHAVLLSIFDSFATADCPANLYHYDSEGNYLECWMNYYSGDGGAHWSLITMPFVDNGLGAPVVAGGQLFSRANCVDGSCSHIVASGDGGQTWHLADQGIMLAMRHICHLTAAATSVFVIASVGACDVSDFAPVVWQSDDAGAHWQRTGALPGTTVITMVAVAVPGVTTPLLYTVDSTLPLSSLEVTSNTSAHSEDVHVSADAGKTWASSPATGIPAGQKLAFDYGILGILPDGRVIIQVIPKQSVDAQAGSILLAWKAGAPSWQQIAPPLTQEVGEFLVMPTGQSSQGTLWVVTQDRGGRAIPPTIIFTVLRYTA